MSLRYSYANKPRFQGERGAILRELQPAVPEDQDKNTQQYLGAHLSFVINGISLQLSDNANTAAWREITSRNRSAATFCYLFRTVVIISGKCGSATQWEFITAPRVYLFRNSPTFSCLNNNFGSIGNTGEQTDTQFHCNGFQSIEYLEIVVANSIYNYIYTFKLIDRWMFLMGSCLVSKNRNKRVLTAVSVNNRIYALLN